MIKLLALDMDGTLLNEAKEIRKPTSLPFTKPLKKVSNWFSVRVPPFSVFFLLQKNWDWTSRMSTSLSIRLFNPSDQWLESSGLARTQSTDIEYLYDLAKKSDVQLTLLMKHYFVLGGKPNQIVQNDAKLVFSDLTEISLEDATSGKYRMFQGMFLGNKRANRRFWAAFCQELCQRFSGVRSQPVIYEAMPLGTTKATALSRLAAILKIEPSEIMAMGDATISKCFSLQGLALLWGNASDHVKSLANDVTASNEEEGVARAIEKYIL